MNSEKKKRPAPDNDPVFETQPVMGPDGQPLAESPDDDAAATQPDVSSGDDSDSSPALSPGAGEADLYATQPMPGPDGQPPPPGHTDLHNPSEATQVIPPEAAGTDDEDSAATQDVLRNQPFATQPMIGPDGQPTAPADPDLHHPAAATQVMPTGDEDVPDDLKATMSLRLPPDDDLKRLSRTIAADDDQVLRVAAAVTQQHVLTMPEAKSVSGLPGAGRPAVAAGRSTWNLRIRQRRIAGHVTGIVNDIPDDPSQQTGLQSALVSDDSAPEYEVLSELGAGNMGVVYRARQTSLNRQVAIKSLKPASRNVDHDQAMFVSEAVVTANLVHPCIVPIHDLGRTADGKLFYTMKQVSGTPWNETIRDNSLEDNLDILMKVCDAVAYAHSRGVINRDLKPENVIVGDYGEVNVLDWGLAITTDQFEQKDSVIVDFRGGCGTPVYMAPELARADISAIGPHSDVYLLGAILFEILEGFPPHLLKSTWQAEHPRHQLQAVIQAVLNNQIEEDVEHTGELMDIARRAMQTDPQDRWASVTDFQEAIREYRITGRAEELMRRAEQEQVTTYETYQTAVALYDDALRKWPNNERALTGDRRARLAYAELAHARGDIDLGLQVLAVRDDPAFAGIRKRLKRTRTARQIVRTTWLLLFLAAVGLSGWLVSTNRELLNAEQALARKTEEAQEQTRIAEEQILIARRERAEADAARQEARQQTERAHLARQEAEKLTREIAAARDEVRAQSERAAAAREEARQARLAAEQQQALALAAEREKEAALQEAERIRIEGRLEQVDAKMEIRRYDDVVRLVDDALKEFPSLADQPDLVELLQKKKEEARRLTGHESVQLPHPSAVAVSSSDGSALVTVSRGEKPILTVFRSVGPHGVSSEDGIRLPVQARSVRRVAVSRGGLTVSAIGRCRNSRRFCHALWRWNGRRYVPVGCSEIDTRHPPHGLLSPDGQYALLMRSGHTGRVTVYRVSPEGTRVLLDEQLDEVAGTFPVIEDAVLLPDLSAVIVATREGCHSIRFRWSGDAVHMTRRMKGEAFSNVFPSPEGLNRLGRDSERSRFRPRQLVLSADGSTLALISGTRLIAIPRDAQAGPQEFPFSSPLQLSGHGIVDTSYGTRIAARFSADGTWLVTAGHRYLQLWRKDGDQYRLHELDGLYDGDAIAGHSRSIRHVSFLPGTGDRLLSVSGDGIVRIWNPAAYGRYVLQMRALRDALHTAARNVLSAPSPPDSRASLPTDRNRPLRRPAAQGPVLTRTIRSVAAARRQRQARRIFSAVFSRDGERIVIGAADLAAHTYQTRSGKPADSSALNRPRDVFFAPRRNNFLEGHIPELVSLCFLPPAGNRLLTLDYFGSVSVWDARDDANGMGFETARLLPDLPVVSDSRTQPYEMEDPSCEIAVSPDGRWIAAAGVRNDGHPDMRRSRDSFFLAVWRSEDVLSMAAPRPWRTLNNVHEARITAAAFSPDGTRIVSGGRRGRLVVWDFAEDRVVAMKKETHNADGVSGAFFVSETAFVTAGLDGQICRWTIDAGELRKQTFERPDSVPDADFIIRIRPSADRTAFVTSDLSRSETSDTTEVRLNCWSVAHGWQHTLPVGIRTPPDDPGMSYRHDVSWSPDGQRLLFVNDERLTVLDTSAWKPVSQFRLPSGHRALRAVFSPDPLRADVIATFDGRFAHLWNIETGDHLADFRSHGPSVRADFSADRRFLITGSDSIRVFFADEQNPRFGTPVFRLSGRVTGNSAIDDVRFSPRTGDYRFAAIDRTGTVRLWFWDPQADPPRRPLAAAPGPPEDTDGDFLPGRICWSSDGQYLAAVRQGRTALWRIVDQELVPLDIQYPQTVSPDRLVMNAVDFSTDGTRLAAGGNEDGIAYALIWNIRQDTAVPEAEIRADEYHSSWEDSADGQTGMTSIAFDDARREILTGGADSRVLRWQMQRPTSSDVVALRYIASLIGGPAEDFDSPHTAAISGLDTTADGSILSADESGYFVIWPADL